MKSFALIVLTALITLCSFVPNHNSSFDMMELEKLALCPISKFDEYMQQKGYLFSNGNSTKEIYMYEIGNHSVVNKVVNAYMISYRTTDKQEFAQIKESLSEKGYQLGANTFTPVGKESILVNNYRSRNFNAAVYTYTSITRETWHCTIVSLATN